MIEGIVLSGMGLAICGIASILWKNRGLVAAHYAPSMDLGTLYIAAIGSDCFRKLGTYDATDFNARFNPFEEGENKLIRLGNSAATRMEHDVSQVTTFDDLQMSVEVSFKYIDRDFFETLSSEAVGDNNGIR